jgi:hypothetical protein
MTIGGKEALLHLLKTKDISQFEHRKIPQTDALFEQKQLSMSAEHEWWYDKLVHGSLLPEHEGEWKGVATLNSLFHDYSEYLTDLRAFKKNTKTILGKFLKKVNPGACPHHRLVVWPNEKTGGQSKQYVWEFPSLKQVREYWDERFFKGEWPEEQVPTQRGDAF